MHVHVDLLALELFQNCLAVTWAEIAGIWLDHDFTLFVMRLTAGFEELEELHQTCGGFGGFCEDDSVPHLMRMNEVEQYERLLRCFTNHHVFLE